MKFFIDVRPVVVHHAITIIPPSFLFQEFIGKVTFLQVIDSVLAMTIKVDNQQLNSIPIKDKMREREFLESHAILCLIKQGHRFFNGLGYTP